MDLLFPYGQPSSEVIVDGIVNGLHKINNIAILELPHGTSRLMYKVNLKCWSNYQYLSQIIWMNLNIQWKNMLHVNYSLQDSSKILVSGIQCTRSY